MRTGAELQHGRQRAGLRSAIDQQDGAERGSADRDFTDQRGLQRSQPRVRVGQLVFADLAGGRVGQQSLVALDGVVRLSALVERLGRPVRGLRRGDELVGLAVAGVGGAEIARSVGFFALAVGFAGEVLGLLVGRRGRRGAWRPRLARPWLWRRVWPGQPRERAPQKG